MTVDSDGNVADGILSNLSKISFGAVFLLLGTVLSKSITIGANAVMARHLGPRTYGALMLGYTLVSLGSILATLGVSEGLPKLLSVEAGRTKTLDYIYSSFSIVLISGITLLTLVNIFTRSVSSVFNTPELTVMLPLLSPYLLLFPALLVCTGILRGLGDSKAVTISRYIGGESVAIVVLIGLLELNFETVSGIAYLLAVPTVSVTLLVTFIAKKLQPSVRMVTFPATETLKEVIQLSWPLAIGATLVTLMTNTDIILLGYFLSSAEVGLYRVVQPLSFSILIVLNSFVFLYLPTAASYFDREEFHELRNLYYICTRWMAILTLPLCVLFITRPGMIIKLLFSADYTAAAPALVLLSSGMFLRVFVGPNGATVKAMGASRIDLLSAIVGFAVNFGLNLFLIPEYGINGAAVATGVGFVSFNAVESWYVYRSIGVNPLSRNIVFPTVVTALAAVVLSQNVFLTNKLASLVFIPLLTVGLGVCSVWVTRAAGPLERTLVSRLLYRFESKLWEFICNQ